MMTADEAKKFARIIRDCKDEHQAAFEVLDTYYRGFTDGSIDGIKRMTDAWQKSIDSTLK
jgi:hypothetical protein